MWQQEKKDSAIANLALLLALATTPTAANLIVSAPLLAQSATETPSFPLPQTVENGTTVRIDGSSDLATINQNLKQSFEKQFAGTKVEVATNSTEAALKALVDGQVDLVGMSRGLTPEEKAQGLEQVVLRREKIAIIVGAENPFKGSLTDRQFARIFRGRITDWSQVGGTAGKIKVIDRPATSEIRKTLSNYPVFKAAKFATGANATQIPEDNTAEIIKQLGKDGISYGIASQISKLPGVRVLQLHQTLPDNPKYPFSQPIVYVYKKNPSPAIASFLGYTLAPPGQQAMEAARAAEANAIANGESQTLLTATTATPSPEATPTATPSAEATPNTELQPTQQQPLPTAISNPVAPGLLWWLLLPLAAISGFVAWLLRRTPSDTTPTNNLPDSDPNSPTPTDNTDVALPVSEPLAQTPAEETPTSSNLSPGTTPAVSNTEENITTPGAAALAGGAAVAAVSATVNNAEAVNQQIKSTDNLNNYTVEDPYDLGQSPWDIEAPAAVVNTSYIPILDVSNNTSTNQPPTVEETDIISNQPDVPIVTPTGEDRDIEVDEESTAEQPQAESNWLEDITATASIPTTTEETDDTTQVNPAEVFSSESAEVTPDLEWPTQVFSDVTPEQSDVAPVPSHNEDEAIAVPEDLTAEQLETELNRLDEITSTESATEDTANVWSEFTETTEFGNAAELPLTEFDQAISDVEWPTAEITTPLPELPDLTEDAFNVVADEAEPTEDETISNLAQETEDLTSAELVDFAESAAITGVGIGAWASIYGIQDSTESEVEAENSAIENIAEDEHSIVTLTPRTPQSADVSWQISEADKQALQASGSQLALLLYDVTGLDLSYQTPQLLQQYTCTEATHDRSVTIPQSDRDYIVEIGYVTDGDHWVKLARSAIVRVFSPPYTHDLVENELPTEDEHSSVVLTPSTHQWVDVSWEISATDKQTLQASGSALELRLYDVTGLDLSYQTPRLLQQYTCTEATHQPYVAIPQSDRDYIAEIGYVTNGDHWVTFARSAIVRVFSPPHTDDVVDNELPTEDEHSIVTLTSRTPLWAEVSWQISITDKQALHAAASPLALRLYDVTGLDLSYQTPQLLQQYTCEEATHQRYVAIPKSDRDYITEIGYITDGDHWVKLARSPIVRVFSPPDGDFWFLADAELIIHGVTQPGATVMIAGNPVTLKSDGSFHLRIPFSNNLIEYLITAVAPNGEQTKIIHKKFSHETLES